MSIYEIAFWAGLAFIVWGVVAALVHVAIWPEVTADDGGPWLFRHSAAWPLVLVWFVTTLPWVALKICWRAEWKR